MPAAHDLLLVLGEWVRKAEGDFLSASVLLKMGRRCPAEVVCFHAQQCAEKYIKSLLVLRGHAFPRTHDIGQLIAQLPPALRPALAEPERHRLTSYAVLARYPGDHESPTIASARAALKNARLVRAHCRKLLPPAALRERGKRP
jgi:HEPN domain-containing protein